MISLALYPISQLQDLRFLRVSPGDSLRSVTNTPFHHGIDDCVLVQVGEKAWYGMIAFLYLPTICESVPSFTLVY